MALVIGDQTATTGLTQSIFEQMDAVLMSAEDKGKLKPPDLEKVRDGWRKLAFAIAAGVIDHLKENMEVTGIKASGTVSLDVKNDSSVHIGTASGSVTLSQSGPTTGHVN
jgi:hypothetical protein